MNPVYHFLLPAAGLMGIVLITMRRMVTCGLSRIDPQATPGRWVRGTANLRTSDPAVAPIGHRRHLR
jgi:hypothetical protein